MMISRWLVTPLFIVACSAQADIGLPAFLEVIALSANSHEPEHGEHAEGHSKHEDPPHVEHARHTDKHVAEHVEHGATPQHAGVNGDCPGNQSANSVAMGLMASVILTPVLVYMTMTKAAGGAVSNLTFRMIDLSTSIFLAVLWFSASADILESATFKKAFPHSEEAFAVLQVLLLYGLTMVVAYVFRHNKYYLLTFCGCAGHYIAFAAIRATGESQHVAGKMVEKDHGVYASFGFCFVVFAILAGMSLVCFFSWRRHIKADEEGVELHLAVEELELDIIGLVLSFAIMQALRHALTGHYPSNAHLLLQEQMLAGDGDFNFSGASESSGCVSPHSHSHTAWERSLMLLFSVVLTIIAMVSLKPLEDLKVTCNYWGHKAVHILQVVLVMCVAWGYLLWGEWQFYETYFHGDKMFGKMVFAVIATVVSLIIIIALAFATHERSSSAKGYANLCVMAVSLVAAFSWEHCFHTAINVIATQYEVGYGGLVPKIVIALCIPLIILPGYIIFLKPIVVEVEEKMYAEEKELLNKHLNEVIYKSTHSAADGGSNASA